MRQWAEGMLAIVVVALIGWLLGLYAGDGESPTTTTLPPVDFDPDAAARGAVIADAQGCLLCHSTDGSPGSGPTFKGLAGSNRPLTTGEFVRADDAYLRRAIVDPSAEVVAGFEDLMPSDFGDRLAEDEIDDLVAFIKSLGS
jgi:cytochrome c oxidase subunit II